MTEILTIVGLGLTVIALALAVYQSFSAKAHTIELQDIKDSMSTRYLGEYPDFIPQISEVISKAKYEVSIVNSVVTTGIFSFRTGWLEYRTTIEKLLDKGKTVNIMMLNKERRQKFEDEQFPNTAEKWEAWKVEPKNKTKIEVFLKHYYPDASFNTLTKALFIEILDDVHNNSLKQSFVAANIVELDEHIPINIWIVDNKQAIFTVPITINGYTDKGFITSDARLIESFNGIIERYKIKVESKLLSKENSD